MQPYLSLLRREWLQHRFGWSLIVGVPLLLSLLALTFGNIETDADLPTDPQQLRLLVSFIALAGTTVVLFTIACVTSIIFMSGLARRDHGDRSVEFWLSLPVGHGASLGAPLVTHLLLVPAAAALVGWVAGLVFCLVLVGRLGGLEAWAGLPWAEVIGASLSLLARLLAGLPLAVLWVLPLVLLLVLMNAWFKRWGWVVLSVAVLALGLLDQFSAGQRWLLDTAAQLIRRAGLSLMGAGGPGIGLKAGQDGVEALGKAPGVALNDFIAALGALASPLFVGSLAASALGFWLLVRWRARGAGLQD